MNSKRKILFLDRDGVINVDFGYVHTIQDFVFADNIFEICRKFSSFGYEIIVITNQSGIARGIFTENDFKVLTEYMVKTFKENGIEILDVFHCPDLESEDRKPNPGMFLKAISKYDVDILKSINVGDSQRDLEAGFRAGIMNNVFIGTLTDIITLS